MERMGKKQELIRTIRTPFNRLHDLRHGYLGTSSYRKYLDLNSRRVCGLALVPHLGICRPGIYHSSAGGNGVHCTHNQWSKSLGVRNRTKRVPADCRVRSIHTRWQRMMAVTLFLSAEVIMSMITTKD